MEEKYYTLKDLAEMFDVTKPGIRKQVIKNEYKTLVKREMINGHETMLINEKAIKMLDKHFKKRNPNVSINASKENDDTNVDKNAINDSDDVSQTSLLATIKILKNEVEHLQKENDSLHLELQHEQELHLQDQQKVKQLEHQQTDINSQDNVKSNVSETETNVKETKKWWQFWK